MILFINAVLLTVVVYMWYILENKWSHVYAGFDATNKHWNYFLCDGVADDVQIQAAIDALPRWGGNVKLDPKTYNLETSILINKNHVSLGGWGGYAYFEVKKDNALRPTKKTEGT